MQTYRVKSHDGTALHVVEAYNRNGIPILFIHGFCQSHLAWRKQFHSDLLHDFRLVSYDLRGHGFSDKPRNMYDSTDVWADDVRSIIQVLQLDHPVLCGWSYGTRIIGDYLQKYGEEEIRGFHFVASVPGKDVVGETWTKIHSKMMSEDAEEIIQANTMLLDAMIHEPMQPEEYFLFQGFQSLVPPHVRKAILSRKPLENPELVKITKPIVITHGLEDKLSLPKTAELGKKRYPDAKLSLFPQVGHAPFWENTERFNQEIRDLLRSL